MNVRLGIAGAKGRMGRAVIRTAAERPEFEVAAAFDRPNSEGAEVEGLRLVSAEDALGSAEAVIDFTTAAASAELAGTAATRGVALVIGSTGFDEDQLARVREAAGTVPIVQAGNFSLGLNVLLGLVEQAARALSAEDYDAEVFEAHHRRKVDAPSGTALMLGEALARGRGVRLEDHAVRVRDGLTGARGAGTIGFSSLRAGGIVGEHSVVLAAEDEILTFHHSARDRSLFARGALEAARWVKGRPPGLYDMQDVLGFRES